MTILRSIRGIALAILLAGTPAVASDADILREAQDRAAITQLMWDYVRAIDGLDADRYAAVFTPDGAFNAVRGSEALRKMVVDLKASQDARRAKGESIGAMHHVMSNQTIAFVDRDHARMQYYWMTVFSGVGALRAPDSKPPVVAAAGRGVDDVVRVGGKWLIKTRNVAPTD